MDLFVVLAFVAVLGLIIAVPLIVGYFLSRKLKLSWKAFIIAAVFFFAVQVLHTPLVLIIQSPFQQWVSALHNHALEVALVAILLGLLAGLFEEIGRFLVLRHYFKKKTIRQDKENALFFGLGWGWGECIFVGVLLIGSLLSYVALADFTPAQIQDLNVSTGGKLTEQQMQQITAQVTALQKLSPFDVFVSFFERMMTLVIQISFTLLVFKAVIANKKSLLALAVLFHAIVDAVAVFSGQFNGIFLTELAIFGFMVIGAAYIWMQFKPAQKAAHRSLRRN